MESRAKFDCFVAIAFMLVGLVLLIIEQMPVDSFNNATFKKIIFIIFFAGLITLLHNIIANIIFQNRINGDESDIDSMQLEEKIQQYMEFKRKKTFKFSTIYSFIVGFVCTLGIVIFVATLANNEENINTWLVLLFTMLTLLIATKQAFISEINKADIWLPILFELDRNLINHELNRIYDFETKLDKKSEYNLLIGIVIAILFAMFVIYINK